MRRFPQFSCAYWSPQCRGKVCFMRFTCVLFFSSFYTRQYYIQQCAYEENQRWPTPEQRQIAKRYQTVIGIDHVAANHEKHYLEFLRLGYFEPIPLSWATNPYNPLTTKSSGQYEDGAGTVINSYCSPYSPILRGAPVLGSQSFLATWKTAPADHAS